MRKIEKILRRHPLPLICKSPFSLLKKKLSLVFPLRCFLLVPFNLSCVWLATFLQCLLVFLDRFPALALLGCRAG